MAARRSGSHGGRDEAFGSPRFRIRGNRDPGASWVAFLAFAAVFVLWGTTFLAMRVAVVEVPPFPLSAMRFLAAGSVLAALAYAFGARSLPRSANLRRYVLSGIAMYAGGNGLLAHGIQFVPSSIAALVIATIPLWMVTIAAALGQIRVSRSVALGVLGGLTGVAIVSDPSGSIDMAAVAVILVGAVSWAAGSLSAGHDVPRDGPFTVVSVQMLAAGALLTIVSAATGQLAALDLPAAQAGIWIVLAWLILPVGVGTSVAYAYALRIFPTQLVAIYPFANTVVAILLGWWILGEIIEGRTLLGSAVILGSAALVIARMPLRRSGRQGL